MIYSLFLASLYLPVAAMLANRLREIRIEEAVNPQAQPGAGDGSRLSVDQRAVETSIAG